MSHSKTLHADIFSEKHAYSLLTFKLLTIFPRLHQNRKQLMSDDTESEHASFDSVVILFSNAGYEFN
jgi:hypothetical protein